MKNAQSETKSIKIEKTPGTKLLFGAKNFTHDFRPQEVKMTNKVLREKSNWFFCWLNKSRVLKQKHKSKK